MNAHIGVDAESGLVHSIFGTAANAFGDAGYRGVHKREEVKGPRWHVAMQPGKRRRLNMNRRWARLLEQAEQLKASVRAKVEHPST